ncbi:hypothetical protein SKAU_G00249270 [Synaphobranchus kaupii]|uniref:MGT5A-like N-terminal domain-containing protein n=1 Tax=Synaphobranchus kaupii TaxID=118154 RepID=A0A9Q1F2I0_SYNKA|nr:hypothetical protein SKAU_G00249270 [Synaphobranchus kaupii]
MGSVYLWKLSSQKLGFFLVSFGFIWGMMLLHFTIQQRAAHESSAALRQQILDLSKRYIKALAEENQNVMDGPYVGTMTAYGRTQTTYEKSQRNIPPGEPERGGRMSTPNGRTTRQRPMHSDKRRQIRRVCCTMCKNPRGLKIHQAKMKCLVRVQLEQRTGSNLGETQEEPGQESTHSAQNLQVPEVQAPHTSQHQVRVKWPPASGANSTKM